MNETTTARNIPREEVDALDHFAKIAGNTMRVRLYDGARKFGSLSWRDHPYTDAENLERLRRAVDHLEAAMRVSDASEETYQPQELYKRAADVANQAFMFADIARRRTP